MPIVVTKSSGFKKNPMPEGLWPAVISEVKDLGVITTQYGDKHYVVARVTDAAGKEASRFWTPSLHEKSTLHKDYKAIKGVPPPDKLDIESLVGTQVQVLISEITRDGEVDARIEKLMKPAPGQNVAITKRPDKNGFDSGARSRTSAKPSAGAPDSTEITDEDIPF